MPGGTTLAEATSAATTAISDVARAAAVGHEMPEMAYCPLELKGAKAKVTSAGNSFAINVSADDAATVAEIEKRSNAISPAP